jgi:hypothetical protein
LTEAHHPGAVRIAATGTLHLLEAPPTPPGLGEGQVRGVAGLQSAAIDRLDALSEFDEDPVVRLAADGPLYGYALSELLEIDLREPCEPVWYGDPLLVVGTPAAGRSWRCWSGPGIEPEGQDGGRVPAGTVGDRFDRFDDGRADWMLLELEDGMECWLPARAVRPLDPSIDASGNGDQPLEFDVAREVTESPSFTDLGELGILTTFDPGARLTGVRMELDLDDAEQIEALRRATDLADTAVADAVRILLPEIARRAGSLEGWEPWLGPQLR